MTKTIYHYDRDTGEYLFSDQADPSPLETDVWLIPAYATEIAPPVVNQSAREIAVFIVDAWKIKSDWRGVDLYSTSDGASVSITQIGQTPLDISATELPPPSAACIWQDNQWVESSAKKAELLVKLKAALCNRIDAAADAARLSVVGDPLRVVEYERAATEAQAYKAADYKGDIPPSVQSAAQAKGWTAQQAADDILTMNALWMTALYSIRATRLKIKETVRHAATEEVAHVAIEQGVAAIYAAVSGINDANPEPRI